MIGNLIKAVINNKAVQRAAVMALGRIISNPPPEVIEVFDDVTSSITTTFNKLRMNITVRTKESELVVDIAKDSYQIGNVDKSFIIQGRQIVNNINIYVNITMEDLQELRSLTKEFHTSEKRLLELKTLINSLDNNQTKIEEVRSKINIFKGHNEPLLNKAEKILINSSNYQDIKQALNEN